MSFKMLGREQIPIILNWYDILERASTLNGQGESFIKHGVRNFLSLTMPMIPPENRGDLFAVAGELPNCDLNSFPDLLRRHLADPDDLVAIVERYSVALPQERISIRANLL